VIGMALNGKKKRDKFKQHEQDKKFILVKE
jgi:hypothetical protein